jgi:hypothetical protein
MSFPGDPASDRSSDESIWLKHAQIAELFQTTPQNKETHRAFILRVYLLCSSVLDQVEATVQTASPAASYCAKNPQTGLRGTARDGCTEPMADAEKVVNADQGGRINLGKSKAGCAQLCASWP